MTGPADYDEQPACRHCGELCDCGERPHEHCCLGCSICAEQESERQRLEAGPQVDDEGD